MFTSTNANVLNHKTTVHGTPQWLPVQITNPAEAKALTHEGPSALVVSSSFTAQHKSLICPVIKLDLLSHQAEHTESSRAGLCPPVQFALLHVLQLWFFGHYQLGFADCLSSHFVC